MLKENTLFGLEDKVKIAIDRIKYFEPKDGSGYYVAFSGGKDSIVIKDLVIKAQVKYDIHFNFTTVDSPELLKYIRNYHSDVQVHRPKESMFQLIVRKKMPPTRIIRYCCEKLKENTEGQDGRVIITGVRWQESYKRSKRRMFEACKKKATRYFLHPIIDWSEGDVWEYIHANKIPYCCLYDEGFKRIGCIGCPMSGKLRIKEFLRWPKYEMAYRHAFEVAVQERHRLIASGRDDLKFEGSNIKWRNGEEMFRWWMEDNHKQENENQCMLFE